MRVQVWVRVVCRVRFRVGVRFSLSGMCVTVKVRVRSQEAPSTEPPQGSGLPRGLCVGLIGTGCSGLDFVFQGQPHVSPIFSWASSTLLCCSTWALEMS